MLVICTDDKVTASRSFKEGETYDVRSHDAKKGLTKKDGGSAKKAYFKPAAKAESDKFYDDKQKKAFNADKIAEIQETEKKAK